MHHFHRLPDGHLACEEVRLSEIADATGTPVYVYSSATLARHLRVFRDALAPWPHLVCFSAKANTNRAVLALLAAGGAGADVVSGGELQRALAAGIPAARIVFSGVGKQAWEVERALAAGICLINVESAEELTLVHRVAAHLGVRAPVALRVNPEVDPGTHPYVATGLAESKFGIPLAEARRLYARAAELPHVDFAGIDCHIGSQLTRLGPVEEAARSVARLADDLRRGGIHLRYLDLGGGLGIRYDSEEPPLPSEYAGAIGAVLGAAADGPTLIVEPGRSIAGNAGVLLTRVLYRKESGARRFVVVDAAMNDLLRPALYDAHHAIRTVAPPAPGPRRPADVVGPVCESGDFLAQGRPMPPLRPGDLLAAMSAGAYGFTMSSTYNSRPRPAEVLVSGRRWAVVRERERLDDLTRGERLPPWAP